MVVFPEVKIRLAELSPIGHAMWLSPHISLGWDGDAGQILSLGHACTQGDDPVLELGICYSAGATFGLECLQKWMVNLHSVMNLILWKIRRVFPSVLWALEQRHLIRKIA